MSLAVSPLGQAVRGIVGLTSASPPAFRLLAVFSCFETKSFARTRKNPPRFTRNGFLRHWNAQKAYHALRKRSWCNLHSSAYAKSSTGPLRAVEYRGVDSGDSG
jgi:hypothetical protein